ncbi:MAG: glycoside hydrolase family 27 protein [Bryobacterales bacterium]|nr:glycoside hydrolase family 27 protein [Bryobacterales bacterium]
MGWASGKHFGSRIDAAAVRQIGDALVNTGLRDAGYRYVLVDAGWQGRRNPQGNLTGKAGFEDLKAVGEYLHRLGLGFGLAASGEDTACGSAEGSAGHEDNDARQFAAWGVDYLRYEWCSGRLQSAKQVSAGARKMAEALHATGRPFLFSLTPRGVRNPELWAASSGANCWRVGPELDGSWTALSAEFDLPIGLDRASAPGHWNELDTMQCAAGLSLKECRAGMSLRALMASPILLGDDVRSLPAGVREIIAEPEVIAIHQDAAGRAGRKIDRWQNREVWARPLSTYSYAVGLFNRGEDTAVVKVSWESLELPYTPRVRDVWKHKNLGRMEDGYSAAVEPHGVVLLRLDR